MQARDGQLAYALHEQINVFCRAKGGEGMFVYRCFKILETQRFYVQQKDVLSRSNLNSKEDPFLVASYYLYDFFMDLPDEDEPRNTYATLEEAVDAFDAKLQGEVNA